MSKLIFILSIVMAQEWELVWSDEFDDNGEVNSDGGSIEHSFHNQVAGTMEKFNITQIV